MREFVEERDIGAMLRFRYAALRPAYEQIRHFLRADAAGNTFAAGFVAIEAHGVKGHVQHSGSVVADDDGAGAEHGAGFGDTSNSCMLRVVLCALFVTVPALLSAQNEPSRNMDTSGGALAIRHGTAPGTRCSNC